MNAIKAIYQGQPGIGGGILATVPAAHKWLVTNIIITNVTNAQAWVSLSKVPNAGTAGVANRICHQLPLNGFQIVPFDLALAMDTVGDFLWGQVQTAAAITVTISGVDVT